MEKRIVSWNVRGLRAEAKVTSDKRVIRKTRANFCFIQESKVETVSVELIRRIWYDDKFEFRFIAANGS